MGYYLTEHEAAGAKGVGPNAKGVGPKNKE